MELGGAAFGALMVVLALALAGVYAVARLRTGKPPPHASEAAHATSEPRGDQDTVPQEAGGGMPMVTPVDDPPTSRRTRWTSEREGTAE